MSLLCSRLLKVGRHKQGHAIEPSCAFQPNRRRGQKAEARFPNRRFNLLCRKLWYPRASRPQEPTPAVVQLPSATPDELVLTITTHDITPELFEPFGQIIGPTFDGKVFDEKDAQLVLDRGQPRFYIMRLPHRGRTFDRITFHRNVTQCLGILAPVEPWFLVVAAPTMNEDDYPALEDGDLWAFKIPHGLIIKLNEGTWHAGPLFDAPQADFLNLELTDTNIVDHNTHDYRIEGISFMLKDD